MPPIEIYKGSKNFWRLRASVDFHLVQHAEFNCIEVISFNSGLHVEAPRVYVSMPAVVVCLGESKIEESMAAKREDMTRKRQPRLPIEELRKLCISELTVEFIISRAQVEINTENHSFEISLLPQVGEIIEDLLIVQPAQLNAHKIARQGRLQTSKDFHDTMKELRTDARKLAQASNAAERLMSLKALAVDGFKHLMDVSHLYSDEMTPAHRRWVRAIRRTIAQRHVALYTARLEEIHRRKEADVVKINKLGTLSAPVAHHATSGTMPIASNEWERRRKSTSKSFSAASTATTGSPNKGAKINSRATFDGSPALPVIEESTIAHIADGISDMLVVQPSTNGRNPNRRVLGISKSLGSLAEGGSKWHHHDISLPALGRGVSRPKATVTAFPTMFSRGASP